VIVGRLIALCRRASIPQRVDGQGTRHLSGFRHPITPTADFVFPVY
jgi:hypothetical protein